MNDLSQTRPPQTRGSVCVVIAAADANDRLEQCVESVQANTPESVTVLTVAPTAAAVNHALGRLAAADDDRLAVYQDLALIRLDEAVQDVHQGGLACPVLAEQATDLTWGNPQVNVIIGHEAAEALRDAAQLKFQPRFPLPVVPAWLVATVLHARPPLSLRTGPLLPGSQGERVYTGLLVACTILPLMISCLIVLISLCNLVGILLAQSWYGARVTPPLASVPR